MTAFSTGIQAIDNHLGSDKPQFILLGARPGVGKTTLAMQIANHMSQRDAKILVCSMEMAKHEIAAFAKPKPGGIYMLNDNPNLTFEDIRNAVEDAAEKNQPYDLIVIDYLQLLSLTAARSRPMQLALLTRNFKQLVINTGVTVLLLAQLNRGATDITPEFREAGAAEQDADLVLMLTQVWDIRTLTIVKNRQGSQGIAHLTLTTDRTFTERDTPTEMEIEQVHLNQLRYNISEELANVLTRQGIEKWWATENRLLDGVTPTQAFASGNQDQTMTAAQEFVRKFDL